MSTKNGAVVVFALGWWKASFFGISCAGCFEFASSTSNCFRRNEMLDLLFCLVFFIKGLAASLYGQSGSPFVYWLAPAKLDHVPFKV